MRAHLKPRLLALVLICAALASCKQKSDEDSAQSPVQRDLANPVANPSVQDAIVDIDRQLMLLQGNVSPLNTEYRIPAMQSAVTDLRAAPAVGISEPRIAYAYLAGGPGGCGLGILWLGTGIAGSGLRFESDTGQSVDVDTAWNPARAQREAAITNHEIMTGIFPDEGRQVNAAKYEPYKNIMVVLPKDVLMGKVKLSILYGNNQVSRPIDMYIAPGFHEGWKALATVKAPN